MHSHATTYAPCPTCPSDPTPIPPEAIDAALASALARIEHRCYSDAIRERAYDACVDAILRALVHYDADAGAFEAYAEVFVDQAIRSTVARPLPFAARTHSLPESADLQPTARSHPSDSDTPPFSDLPEELQTICTLYYLHEYTLAEVSLLTGLAVSTLHGRLETAAHLLRDQEGG